MNTTIVYGPPACGKTRNAQYLAKYFGCDAIIDDWEQRRHALVAGAVHLTNILPKDTGLARIVEFKNIPPRLAPVKRKVPKMPPELRGAGTKIPADRLHRLRDAIAADAEGVQS